MRTSKEIALRNDEARKTLRSDANHKVFLTEMVAECDHKGDILEAVKNFDSFSGDNDPYEEHDFGSFEIKGETYMFKLDYYDKNYEYGADPREEDYNLVLTIMHSSER